MAVPASHEPKLSAAAFLSMSTPPPTPPTTTARQFITGVIPPSHSQQQLASPPQSIDDGDNSDSDLSSSAYGGQSALGSPRQRGQHRGGGGHHRRSSSGDTQQTSPYYSPQQHRDQLKHYSQVPFYPGLQQHQPQQQGQRSPSSMQQSHPYMASLHSHSSIDGLRHQQQQQEPEEAQEDDCPVCLEPLSLRLQGEKPHVEPACGHILHYTCFEAVYGSVQRAKQRSGGLGVCGVCRRDMKISDDGGSGGKSTSKFAAMAGIPQNLDSHKVRSITRKTIDPYDGGSLHDPGEDDDIVPVLPAFSAFSIHGQQRGSAGTHTTSSSTTESSTLRRGSNDTMKPPGSSSHGSTIQAAGVPPLPPPPGLKPIITARAEHQTITRSFERDRKQHLTCMVTIEMPTRYPFRPSQMMHLHQGSPSMGGGAHEEDYHHHHHHHHHQSQQSQQGRHGRVLSQATSAGGRSAGGTPGGGGGGGGGAGSMMRPGSPAESQYSAYAYGSTSVLQQQQARFESVIEDLRTRMADWKGHQPDDFGILRVYDYIHVRKDKNVKEFIVYLFEEALLCVTDDRRRGLTGKIVDNLGGQPSDRLRLKGRVYVRHIKSIENTSQSPTDLSLTITMADDTLDEFVMTFKEMATLRLWQTEIDSLLREHQAAQAAALNQQQQQEQSSPVTSSIGTPVSSVNNSPTSRRMVPSASAESHGGSSDDSHSSKNFSSFSGYTRTTTSSVAPFGGYGIQEEDPKDVHRFNSSAQAQQQQQGAETASISAQSVIAPSIAAQNEHLQFLASPGQSLRNREFPSLDLMLILSVPPPGSSNLKVNIIKQTLDFLVQKVGPRTRISLVTFATGEGSSGVLRKTPFIAVGKTEGRRRFEQIISELDSDYEGGASGGGTLTMIEHKEQHVNVVTAVNLALDIVLQRKSKSSLSGILLMNDKEDKPQKQQMDLVMARADAAKVPIHAIGWGKTHEPGSLWILSNHTGGTYTFVKDFYDFQNVVAGCVGAMLSIACTNVKVHVHVPEKQWFRVCKVAGTPNAIVSSDGLDVDIQIGELRFGEKKEILVEIEMSLAGGGGGAQQDQYDDQVSELNRGGFATATDEFFLNKVGLNPSTLEDVQVSTFYEDEYDTMPDDVPLFEVKASYRDAIAGKNVARINQQPCLLTIMVVPPTAPGQRPPMLVSDPFIVGRRMELLTSDMLTRTMLLMARRADNQAMRLLKETQRIISTIMASLSPPPKSRSAKRMSYFSAQTVAQGVLLACAEDVAAILEGCSDREQWDGVHKYFSAQQAVVLRDQKAFTGRTASERVHWTSDNSLWLCAASKSWNS